MRVETEGGLNELQLYLEYADGGELFDQIEPDVGMPPVKAQFYFRQLLNGLQHIHSMGVVHRDIKPENLLLTGQDVLKISDFGMATVFRHSGRERMLNAACGTMPYASPQVIKGLYKAEPVDIWSSGVVLVAMLAGELPWDSASKYVYGKVVVTATNPWKKIDNTALCTAMLIENENLRATLQRILEHPWTNAGFGKTCYYHILLTSCFVYRIFTSDPMAMMVRRMTRFCVTICGAEVLPRIVAACVNLGFLPMEKANKTARTYSSSLAKFQFFCI
ncbi:unnamed protein product [Angiostrongylus costaricensis]|uniref:non-specific serine/threonine protein kinase n=1 Tax=Angiostrongylus costaricensis TaxID=334426 RepID=A0A0R3PYE9_ANGCS|nr:unnamed protein product [Angiostrongylus costaricensis]